MPARESAAGQVLRGMRRASRPVLWALRGGTLHLGQVLFRVWTSYRCPPEPEARFASPHAITRGQGQRGHETYALRLLGEITSRGDPLDAETAEGYYRQALTLATELEMRPLVAHCHLGLGKLYRRSGDHVQAHQHLMTASAMYREMDMGFWLEKAESALA